MSSYTGLSSFLSGANETYIAELYERYLRDPGAVDPAWADLFRDLEDGPEEITGELRGASWSPRPIIRGSLGKHRRSSQPARWRRSVSCRAGCTPIRSIWPSPWTI